MHRNYLTGLMLVLLCGCMTVDTTPPAPLESIPWDVTALNMVPGHEWLETEGPVRALLYQGEPYKGNPTRVFAYYATPGTLFGNPAKDKNLPAVVLVHGGGGTAFRQWVRLWARRGYAAIAMDLAGCGEGQQRMADGGPAQTHPVIFGEIDAPQSDQWTYHAVADVILAHSLLRSFPEVDPDRTALTGISWGGYLTCIVAGLDHRFKAAVPVYGCGFLQDNSAWLGDFAGMTPPQQEKWHRLWDPSIYVGSARMPVFFVNGTNDFAYPLDSYEKTYDLVEGTRNQRITINMPHGHSPGWRPKEIGLFIDQHLIEGVPLPSIGQPGISKEKAFATIRSKTKTKSAQLCYTTDTNAINKRTWKTIPAKGGRKKIKAPAPPPDTTVWFFTATDQRSAIVSSPIVICAK